MRTVWAQTLGAAPATPQTPVRPKVDTAPRLAVTQEEPLVPRPRPRSPETAGRAEAAKKTPSAAKPPLNPAAAEPLPLPPRPPAVPPPRPGALPPPAPAGKLPEPEKPEGAPAQLPRFASLRSDEVNMRVGPGARYRIQWVYKRRDLPVEITREFENWRYVRDADGVQGWMQQATLMGRRTFIIQGADATLREEARDGARAVAELKTGVIGRIRSCEAGSDWCQVQAGAYRGFLRREQFWGTLPHEVINP